MTSQTIIDVCAYHRRDFDLVLVRSRPHETQHVLESLQTPFKAPPTSGLGILDQLPFELLSMVLRSLDLLSYFQFRKVNRRARVLSTALSEYQAVAKHGLEGLRGLLRTGLAPTLTIEDLYRPLHRYPLLLRLHPNVTTLERDTYNKLLQAGKETCHMAATESRARASHCPWFILDAREASQAPTGLAVRTASHCNAVPVWFRGCNIDADSPGEPAFHGMYGVSVV